ncbi:MAG: hypothetical protein ACMUIA_08400 [bacterium]
MKTKFIKTGVMLLMALFLLSFTFYPKAEAYYGLSPVVDPYLAFNAFGYTPYFPLFSYPYRIASVLLPTTSTTLLGTPGVSTTSLLLASALSSPSSSYLTYSYPTYTTYPTYSSPTYSSPSTSSTGIGIATALLLAGGGTSTTTLLALGI